MSLSIAEIENNLEKVFNNFNREEFIYEFILSFGVPQSTIKRLKSGKFNLADNAGELAWRKKVFFKETDVEGSLYEQIDSLKTEDRIRKGEYRFAIVTNYVQWVAVDMKTAETLDCTFETLQKHFDFFLPLAGIEKAQYLAENPADVKAAERMAKLYDQINVDNDFKTEEELHGLNVFLSRLLFCFFAEDTGIFKDQQFTHGIESATNKDASDIQEYLEDLFEILNLPVAQRAANKVYLHQFPYVNGGLFKDSLATPRISVKARSLILECGRLDWKAINPDIFGSMIQAVVATDKRGGLGMHYTSVPNIMKVINPLFLDDLKEIFEKAKGSKKDLNALLDRLKKIKIFDPACGSGNFLIIAYKELRLLEIEILRELAKVTGKAGTGTFDLGNEFTSVISLNNFYGIEIDDFAHEIARLSLWLAEHQMNQYFYLEFGFSKPSLPLKDAGHIVHANACRVDWEEVCPKREEDEIYILGNPPYLGSFLQSKEQKLDLELVCKGFKSYKDLDYISVWFIKSAKYATSNKVKFAFVTTNSICQGEQVGLLWPYILDLKLEIFFAYQSFKWVNNAKGNAGVYCSIIGVEKISTRNKTLFTINSKLSVKSISPYLTSGVVTIIKKHSKPISRIPVMNYGSKIVDAGNLILTREEKDMLIFDYPFTNNIIRKFIGSAEFIRGTTRYILYIDDDVLELAKTVPFIKERLENVEKFRGESTEVSTRAFSSMPHKYYYSVHNDSDAIIIPRTSSIRRDYIPMGFLNGESIISDSASVVYSAKLWIFGILSSKIHMIWVRAVGGRLKTDYRYSSQLCYNTFPFPKIGQSKEKELEESAFKILEIRERYPEKTLAQLYDPEKMPKDLKQAHLENDLLVESCYHEKLFTSDEERLEYLFKLYEKMIKEEQKSK